MRIFSIPAFVFMASSLLSTAKAQTYKVGDIHPDGGIIAIVDAVGTSGVVVDEKDSGPYTPAEAVAAARAKGAGWGVPYLKDLRLVYQNLHKQGLGGFQPALYQTVDDSSGQYRRGLHFNDGKEETGIAQNNKTLVRFVRGFKPGLREQVLAENATYEGDWSWDKDDAHGKTHSKLTVKSANDFVYVYAGQTHNLKGNIGYARGVPGAPLCVNLDLPHGDHLRFEWKSAEELEGHFWAKGKKAGVTKNNTPETVAIMKRSAK